MSTVALSNRRTALVDTIIAPSVVTDVLLAVVGAAFVGLLAQISWTVHPFVVPFTGQTLGVLVVGASFGLRRSLAAMALYLVAGLAGVPWFADHAHGYHAVHFLRGNVRAIYAYIGVRHRHASHALGLLQSARN